MAALAVGATAVTALVCLLAMYAGVPAAGTVNDWLNGALGWLALGLLVFALLWGAVGILAGATHGFQ